MSELAEQTTRDVRIDQFLKSTLAICAVFLGGTIWDTGQDILDEQRKMREETAEKAAELTRDLALLAQKVSQMNERLLRFRDVANSTRDEVTRVAGSLEIHRDRHGHNGTRDELSKMSDRIEVLIGDRLKTPRGVEFYSTPQEQHSQPNETPPRPRVKLNFPIIHGQPPP